MYAGGHHALGMQESLGRLGHADTLLVDDPTASDGPDPSSLSGAQSLMVVSSKQPCKTPIRYFAQDKTAHIPRLQLLKVELLACILEAGIVVANSFPFRIVGSASPSKRLDRASRSCCRRSWCGKPAVWAQLHVACPHHTWCTVRKNSPARLQWTFLLRYGAHSPEPRVPYP